MERSTTGLTAGSASPPRHWRPFALAAACYTALAIVQTFPLILRLSSVVPHDVGDPLMSTAILWWNAHVLPFTERWWNGFAFFPAHGFLAFSDPRVGEGLIATPLQWLGLDPVAAYNLTFLATFPLSALAAHWLAFELTGQHDAAAIAGVAYGFCPYRGAHLAHLELLAAYGMPAALTALHAFLRTRRARWLVVFALALVVQGLSSSYYLLFFSVLLAVWLPWFLRARDMRALAAIAAAGAAAMIVLLPQTVGYLRIHRFHGFQRAYNEIVLFSADATSLLAADPGLFFWGWTSKFGDREGLLWPGVVLPTLVGVYAAIAWRRSGGRDRLDRAARWLAAAAAVSASVALCAWTLGPWRLELPGFRMSSDAPQKPLSIAVVLLLIALGLSSPLRQAARRRAAFAFYALAAVLLFICSFGPRPMFAGHEFLYRPPYAWLMNLPVFSSIRVPARFGMPAVLALAVAGALAFHGFALSPRRRQLAAMLVCLGLVADGWFAPVPLVALPNTWPATHAEGFTAVLELPLGDLFDDLAAAYRATVHGRPLVNGASGFQPGHYAAVRTALVEHDPIALDWLPPSGRVLVVIDRESPSASEWDQFMSSYPRVARLASDDRWLFYALDPASPPPSACEGSKVGIQAVTDARGPVDISPLVDGNPATWWVTPGRQQEGDGFTITLRDSISPCALVLAVGTLYPTYPRSLVVESSVDGTQWTMVAHIRTSVLAIRAALADPKQTAFAIPLAPMPARFLRLRLDQANLEYPWHVTELEVRAETERNQ